MEKVLCQLHSKLAPLNKYKDVVTKCKSLCTDEERVIFTLNVMSEYNIIPKECGDGKDASKSASLREEGNKLFVLQPLTRYKCVNALKLYTTSIAFAPYQSDELGLAYANRSAVLIKLHKYKECVKDIDRALSLIRSEHVRAKLYIRKIECLKILKHSDLGNTIQETQEYLEKMSIDDSNKRKLNDKLISAKNMKLPNNAQKINATRKDTVTPFPVLKAHNTEAPCASDALSIKYTEEYGRHVVANRDIKAGEIIVIEQAYSIILNPDNFNTHCSNCFKQCWTNIPCSNCTHAMYCSEECKESAWKQCHDIECTVFPSLLKMDFSKLDLFGLRIAIQAVRECSSIEELRELVKEVESSDDPRTKGFSKNGIFESDKYRSVLSLVTNTEKRSFQDLFRRSMDASFILYFLATCSNMFGSPLKKDLSGLIENPVVTFVGGLIMRHQQTVPTNMHSFQEETDLGDQQHSCVTMPFLSLMNHSCCPNITRQSREGHFVVYALFPIKEGEQILDNYGQHYAIAPAEERQKALLKQYHFKCQCEPCIEDWPLYFDLMPCRMMLKSAEYECKLHDVLRKLNLYINIATTGDVFNKPYLLDSLFQIMEILYNSLWMPSQEMASAVETVVRVLSLHGDRFILPEL